MGKLSEAAAAVVIGMDPHKRSVTIEVMAGDETVLGGGRFATTVEGYRAMEQYVARWNERVWAVEGAPGSAAMSRPVCSVTASR
jgi:transposase